MDLQQNPFYILHATPRDSRQRIMELAEERSLILDSSEGVMEAHSDLTNPRRRLTAEVAWLPGVGPRKAGEMLSLLESSPRSLPTISKLPSLARVNLLAAGLARLSDFDVSELNGWILDISRTFENVDFEELKLMINEERIVARFSEVLDISAIEAEVQEQRRYYCQVIKSALDNLSSGDLVKAVTLAIESATRNGQDQSPILIDDLVDSYELDAQEFLEKEGENINTLVDRIQFVVDAEKPDSNIDHMVDQLIRVVKNWDTIAQPIQVSKMSRGEDHDASHRIAHKVRDLAIHMFNEHDKLEYSQRITSMLQEVFAEVALVVERVDKDAEALEDIARQRDSKRLLDPIINLCNEVRENSEKHPEYAYREANKIMKAADQLIKNLSASNAGIELITMGKDILALTIMHCAIVYGNKTQQWKQCISFLEEAGRYAKSQEVKSRIMENLKITKNNLSGSHDSNNFNGAGYLILLRCLILLIGFFVIFGIVYFVSDPASKSPSFYQTSSQRNSDYLQYTRPSIGTNNVLSVSEIRWCLRENIRIKALQDAVNTNAQIQHFNRLVENYNGRCGNYRYRQESMSQAERDIEPRRSRIAAEAIRAMAR